MFSKNTQISIFMEISPEGAKFFHVEVRADGQSDITKLIVAFSSFVNGLKKHKI
jgi:hypothetical protein